jgi:Ca-activated chloride channel family protein
MLTFAYPRVLLLAPLPLVIWWLVPAQVQQRAAVRVPFLFRLLQARQQNFTTQATHALSLMTQFGIWLLLLTATARPQWLEPPVEKEQPTRDMLLLVDLSGSMETKDFTTADGTPVDRLSAVKEVVGEFLKRRNGDRVGLVVFGNAPFLQAPFTTDLALCRQLLDETAVRMAGPRTALGDAMGLGIQVFENSDAPDKVMIALTDGNDTGSGVPLVQAARVARDREITIHTVAMGDPTTVGEEQLDQQALQEVAEVTGGQSFLALNRGELEHIYVEIDSIETRKVKTTSFRPRIDLYYWPVAIALVTSLTSHFLKLRPMLRWSAARSPDVRLRVNARTFDLETTEQ